MIRALAYALIAYVAALASAVGLSLVIALLTLPARSQGMTPGLPLAPLGYCRLTDLSSATGLASCSGGIPSGSNIAFVTIEAAGVRWRDDNVLPTTSVGMLIPQDGTLLYSGTLSAFQVIAQSGSPIVNVSFYRSP